MVCSSRIVKLGLLTTLVNICSSMKTLSFFLVHVQRSWKCKDFQKSYLTNLKKSDSATFYFVFSLYHMQSYIHFYTQFNGL